MKFALLAQAVVFAALSVSLAQELDQEFAQALKGEQLDYSVIRKALAEGGGTDVGGGGDAVVCFNDTEDPETGDFVSGIDLKAEMQILLLELAWKRLHHPDQSLISPFTNARYQDIEVYSLDLYRFMRENLDGEKPKIVEPISGESTYDYVSRLIVRLERKSPAFRNFLLDELERIHPSIKWQGAGGVLELYENPEFQDLLEPNCILVQIAKQDFFFKSNSREEGLVFRDRVYFDRYLRSKMSQTHLAGLVAHELGIRLAIRKAWMKTHKSYGYPDPHEFFEAMDLMSVYDIVPTMFSDELLDSFTSAEFHDYFEDRFDTWKYVGRSEWIPVLTWLDSEPVQEVPVVVRRGHDPNQFDPEVPWNVLLFEPTEIKFGESTLLIGEQMTVDQKRKTLDSVLMTPTPIDVPSAVVPPLFEGKFRIQESALVHGRLSESAEFEVQGKRARLEGDISFQDGGLLKANLAEPTFMFLKPVGVKLEVDGQIAFKNGELDEGQALRGNFKVAGWKEGMMSLAVRGKFGNLNERDAWFELDEGQSMYIENKRIGITEAVVRAPRSDADLPQIVSVRMDGRSNIQFENDELVGILGNGAEFYDNGNLLRVDGNLWDEVAYYPSANLVYRLNSVDFDIFGKLVAGKPSDREVEVRLFSGENSVTFKGYKVEKVGFGYGRALLRTSQVKNHKPVQLHGHWLQKHMGSASGGYDFSSSGLTKKNVWRNPNAIHLEEPFTFVIGGQITKVSGIIESNVPLTQDSSHARIVVAENVYRYKGTTDTGETFTVSGKVEWYANEKLRNGFLLRDTLIGNFPYKRGTWIELGLDGRILNTVSPFKKKKE